MWNDKFNWLCGSSSTDYFYCWPCLLFSNKDSSVWGSAQCGSMWITEIVGYRCWMPWYDWFTLDSFCSSTHLVKPALLCCWTTKEYNIVTGKFLPVTSIAAQKPSLEIRSNLASNQTTFKTISNDQNDPCDQRILKPVTKNVTRRRDCLDKTVDDVRRLNLIKPHSNIRFSQS